MKTFAFIFSLTCFTLFAQQATDLPNKHLFLYVFTASTNSPTPDVNCLIIKVRLDDDFEVKTYDSDGLKEISGRLEMRDGKLVANLKGSYYTSIAGFNGTPKLEKAFSANWHDTNHIFFPLSFILSTNGTWARGSLPKHVAYP